MLQSSKTLVAYMALSTFCQQRHFGFIGVQASRFQSYSVFVFTLGHWAVYCIDKWSKLLYCQPSLVKVSCFISISSPWVWSEDLSVYSRRSISINEISSHSPRAQDQAEQLYILLIEILLWQHIHLASSYWNSLWMWPWSRKKATRTRPVSLQTLETKTVFFFVLSWNKASQKRLSLYSPNKCWSRDLVQSGTKTRSCWFKPTSLDGTCLSMSRQKKINFFQLIVCLLL